LGRHVAPPGTPRSAFERIHRETVDPSYRVLLDVAGSHTDGQVAGTYGFGQGDPLAADGAAILTPLKLIAIAALDFLARGELAIALRIRAELAANATAPGSDFTIGLHPVTRPVGAGGAGAASYAIGAAIAGSTVTFAAPAADDLLEAASADFDLPADGFYVLGCVTSAAVAAAAHVHLSAQLQARYV
jgi:hypothetical protein